MPELLNSIAKLISGHRFRFENEAELQTGIDQILAANNVQFLREFRLSDTDRVDFLIDGQIALEVKLATSLVAISRQLWRYSQSESIKALILVTTRQRHRQLPEQMNGKPLTVIALEMAF